MLNATKAPAGREEREPTVSEFDHEGKAGDHEVIKGVVDAEGPAVHIRHEHDYENASHEVHSRHESGHTHHSYGHPSVTHALAHHAYAADEDSLGARIDKKS